MRIDDNHRAVNGRYDSPTLIRRDIAARHGSGGHFCPVGASKEAKTRSFVYDTESGFQDDQQLRAVIDATLRNCALIIQRRDAQLQHLMAEG